MTFIDEHRDRFGGVETICTVLTEHGLSTAPSTYHAAKARPPSARTVRDAELKVLAQEVFETNYASTGPARSGTTSGGRGTRSPAARSSG
ncbi:hypothetical protein [Actinacidiphila sp. DG2A-62]|uniref:hypothetical protein n=1 Tax=Actinacidiphila sp. DG2A-62 TaxID=3108821 RepID=UPI003FA37330